MLKEYIAVLDTVPDHMVPVLVAHSVLGAHILFGMNDSTLDYQKWLKDSFRKVVLRVNKKELEKIMDMEDVYFGYENTVDNANTTCVVVCPREEYPNVIKFAKMWKPKE